jgi:hypothetical protein
MNEFEYIRECVMKNIKPDLSLVEMETLSSSGSSDILVMDPLHSTNVLSGYYTMKE